MLFSLMADSESSTTATVAAESSKPTEIKRWADVADWEADSVAEPNLDSLGIDESKPGSSTLENSMTVELKPLLLGLCIGGFTDGNTSDSLPCGFINESSTCDHVVITACVLIHGHQKGVVTLKAFSKFENTSEALSAATILIDSKPIKGLRKFLRGHCDGDILAVADSKLGNSIKEKLSYRLEMCTQCCHGADERC